MYDRMTYIEVKDGSKLLVPDNPTIGYIEGDGIGSDITRTTIQVVNSALEAAYKDSRSIEWKK